MTIIRSNAAAHGPLIFVLLIGVLAILSACTSLQPDYDEPEVSITSFRAVPSNESALAFEIGLRIVNPNSEALKLRGVAYTVSLEGHKLITGVGSDLPVVDGYSEATLTLQASASMFQAIKLFGDLMRGPKSSLKYTVETKLDVGTSRPAIRVKDSGEISLQPPAQQ